MLTRKMTGLILSGIGGLLFLVSGIIILSFSMGFYYLGISFPISYLITGVFSLIGIIIGLKQIRLGGTVILIAMPFAIIYVLIFSFTSSYYIIMYLLIPFWPIPYFPYVVLVIIGGVLCRISSD
ncbi:MAG: hypothetical protein ACFFA4_14735 [Promethearchaeota archaeon]